MVPPEDVDGDLEAAVFIEDPNKQRKCPICRYNLHLYNINEEQMFLMCENDICEFPFGYEPLQVVQHESQLVDNPPPCTKDFFEYPVGGIGGVPPTPLGSISGSMAADTLSTVMSIADSDNMTLDDSDATAIVKQEVLSVRLGKESRRRKIKQETNTELLNQLKRITQMNKELKEIDEEEKKINSKLIKNEKWLKNLKMWEGTTGKQLLSDQEKSFLKKTEPEFAVGELKISIDPLSAMPSVKIEILEQPVNNEST